MKQKKVFQFILAALALGLMVLPFMVSFNDFLTKVVERSGWYLWIQTYIVPWEIGLVKTLLSPFKIRFIAYPEGFRVNGVYARLTWNCIGWQSMLLFLISLPIGFKGGRFKLSSMLEAVVIGLLGTFLVNLLRMVFTILLLAFFRPLFAVVFHDYLAALMTIGWLFLFWWFSYSFVLQQKSS